MNSRIAIIGLALLAFGAAGCVERELVIRTEPEDALVIVDDSEVGRSPAVMPFTFYGTRRVTLEKEGYATSTHYVDVSPPWYQRFPLDFFSEILYPATLVDTHVHTFTLKPPEPVDTDALLDRAESLRDQVRQP